MDKILKCPVCGQDLVKKDKAYVCANNHSFDLSKRGYLNLLLVNQTHSVDAGDNKEMMDARTNFLDAGYYKSLNDKLINIIKNYINNDSIILDIGCGTGYYTYNIAKNVDCNVIGLDISKVMVNEASKKINLLNNLNYIVSSSSHIPFKNNSIDMIISCFSPLDLEEVKRVLKKDGKIIKVTPGEYHLFELKEILYEKPYLNEISKISDCDIENSYKVKEEITVENGINLQNLYKMTPYYYKTAKSSAAKIEAINNLKITIDFNIDVYKYL